MDNQHVALQALRMRQNSSGFQACREGEGYLDLRKGWVLAGNELGKHKRTKALRVRLLCVGGVIRPACQEGRNRIAPCGGNFARCQHRELCCGVLVYQDPANVAAPFTLGARQLGQYVDLSHVNAV
jgi:hypothetical protein